MNKLIQKIKTSPIIYVSRDIERTIGLDIDTPGSFIISNNSDFAKSISKNHPNVLLINAEKMLDTWELMEREELKKIVEEISKSKGKDAGKIKIIVFKNTPQIEIICKKNKWRLLNPPAKLSSTIENKITQLEWLGSLQKFLPEHEIKECKNIVWKNKKFILQFNRAHTGSGTILIKSKKQLSNIQKQFPDRPVRITKYIDGPMFTNNNVVAKDKILLGNINYQITGLSPFTNSPFTTIGNDWGFAKKYLTSNHLKQYQTIVMSIGKKLQKQGWRGLFGVDVIIDKKNGRLYLIEINARQPASTTYESQLQNDALFTAPNVIQDNKFNLTTFEAHLMALFGINLKDYNLIKIEDGAQIILRNKDQELRIKNQTMEMLKKNCFNFIHYNNIKPGSDLLRIQSKKSIMQKHKIFNKTGNLIKKIIEHGLN